MIQTIMSRRNDALFTPGMILIMLTQGHESTTVIIKELIKSYNAFFETQRPHLIQYETGEAELLLFKHFWCGHSQRFPDAKTY